VDGRGLQMSSVVQSAAEMVETAEQWKVVSRQVVEIRSARS